MKCETKSKTKVCPFNFLTSILLQTSDNYGQPIN